MIFSENDEVSTHKKRAAVSPEQDCDFAYKLVKAWIAYVPFDPFPNPTSRATYAQISWPFSTRWLASITVY